MFWKMVAASMVLGITNLIPLTPAPGDIVLENNFIRLCFDDSTFVLKQIEGDGSTYTFEPNRTPLWAVTLLDTTEEWVEASDLRRFGPTGSIHQTYELVDSLGGEKLALRWSNINLFDTGTLSVLVDVYLPPGEAESFWSITVYNTSDQFAVFSVDFPFLSVHPGFSSGRLDALAYPSHAGALFSNPAESVNLTLTQSMDVDPEEIGFAQTYPGAVSMQFFHLYDTSNLGGLFCTPLDMAGFMKRYHLKGQGDFIECFIRQYPENNHLPNSHYRQPYDILLRPFVGDWIEGAKFYRELVSDAPWMNRRNLRRAEIEDDSTTVQPVVLILEWNDFIGNPDLAVDIVTQYREFLGGKLGVGLHIRWWWDAFLYNGTISSDLVQFITTIKNAGIRVASYSSTRDWRENIWPDPRAEKSAARNLNGLPYRDSTFQAYIMDPASDAWRDLFVSKATELVQNFGATDIYMDNHPIPRLCYQSDHGHALGGGTYWMDGYRDICTRLNTQNPEALLANESRCEQLLPWLDFFPATYWATGQWESPFAPRGALPVPLVACTYHDHVHFLGSTPRPWNEHRRYQFTFENGYAFVNGNVLSLRVEQERIADFPVEKQRDWYYIRKLTKYQNSASHFLLRGEWMRPPVLHGFPTVEVEFPSSYPPMYQTLLTSSVLTGAFKSKDGMIGFAFANFTDSTAEGTVSARLSDYGVPVGPYHVYEMGMWGNIFLTDSISGDFFDIDLSLGPRNARFFIITNRTKCTKGDANGDGEINVFDVLLAVNISLALHEPTVREWCAADYNSDNAVNLTDILSIVYVVLGREP